VILSEVIVDFLHFWFPPFVINFLFLWFSIAYYSSCSMAQHSYWLYFLSQKLKCIFAFLYDNSNKWIAGVMHMAFFFMDFLYRICIQHFLYVIRNCKQSGGVKLSGNDNLHIKTFQEIRYCIVFSELLVTCVVLWNMTVSGPISNWRKNWKTPSVIKFHELQNFLMRTLQNLM